MATLTIRKLEEILRNYDLFWKFNCNMYARRVTCYIARHCNSRRKIYEISRPSISPDPTHLMRENDITRGVRSRRG